jgi:hypothetical protein
MNESFVDLCVRCRQKELDELAAGGAANRRLDPTWYFRSGEAAAELEASGVPKVEIFEVKHTWSRGRWREKRAEELVLRGYGWSIGSFTWSNDDGTVTLQTVVVPNGFSPETSYPGTRADNNVLAVERHARSSVLVVARLGGLREYALAEAAARRLARTP